MRTESEVKGRGASYVADPGKVSHAEQKRRRLDRCGSIPSLQLGFGEGETSQSAAGKLYVVKDFSASTHFEALSILVLTALKYAIVGV